MHIVTIRRNAVVEGYQLRFGGSTPGHTKFFAAKKHGGAIKARQAALAEAADRGLGDTAKRGGSPVGRVTRRSRTGAAGIRFVWQTGADASTPRLYVFATWTDKKGRPHCTSYSVERHGLGGALDKAMTARQSCGAPVPGRRGLLAKLRAEFQTA